MTRALVLVLVLVGCGPAVPSSGVAHAGSGDDCPSPVRRVVELTTDLTGAPCVGAPDGFDPAWAPVGMDGTALVCVEL